METLLFLDFDGVITTYRCGFNFDPEKLKLLDEIIKATDCKIVISSSWRKESLEKTKEVLHFLPFKDRIVGVTPILDLAYKQNGWHFNTPTKGLEIDAYLNSIKEDVNYVILDDDVDFLWSQKDHFVKVDPYEGLSKEDVKQVIKRFDYGKIK